MKCEKCGYVNEAGAKFCAKCGSPLSSQPPKKKKPWKLWLIAILVIILACAAAIWLIFLRPQEKSYASILEEAQRYVTELNYEEAETLYLEAIDIEPKKAEAYVSLANMYIENEEPEKAVSIMMEAEENVAEEEQPAIEDQKTEMEDNGMVVAWVTDAYSDYKVITSTMPETKVCYHIPHINLSRGKADAINQEIYDELYALLDEQVYQQLEEMPDAEPSLNRMLYAWGRAQDVISINVLTSPYYHYPEYRIYNVSMSTGQALSDEELLSIMSMTDETFRETVKQVLTDHMNDWRSELPSESEYITEEMITNVVNQTIADENVAEARPYLNANGELCFVVRVYSIAGAGSYWTLFNSVSGEIEPDIVCQVNHESTNNNDTSLNLTEGYWENRIQSRNVIRFNSNWTVDVYQVNDLLGEVTEDNLSYVRTDSFSYNGEQLTITWDNGYTTGQTELELMTVREVLELNPGMSYVLSELDPDEQMLYESSWVSTDILTDEPIYYYPVS